MKIKSLSKILDNLHKVTLRIKIIHRIKTVPGIIKEEDFSTFLVYDWLSFLLLESHYSKKISKNTVDWN